MSEDEAPPNPLAAELVKNPPKLRPSVVEKDASAPVVRAEGDTRSAPIDRKSLLSQINGGVPLKAPPARKDASAPVVYAEGDTRSKPIDRNSLLGEIKQPPSLRKSVVQHDASEAIDDGW